MSAKECRKCKNYEQVIRFFYVCSKRTVCGDHHTKTIVVKPKMNQKQRLAEFGDEDCFEGRDKT